MFEQHYLREENYQLKNEITDLKNAFDLNRDILKILSAYNSKTDHHYNLLMQIITRLTSVNNQAMLNNIELIHQKNALKQQNIQLNERITRIQKRLKQEMDINGKLSQVSESKVVMQEQFNVLSRELLATNEERIIKEQEVQFWKDKCKNSIDRQSWKNVEEQLEKMASKITRRYTSKKQFKYQVLFRELQKQNRRLKNHIDELENRLMLFVKVHKAEEPTQETEIRESTLPFFQNQRQEIRLLKYALNDIHIDRKENESILTITTRFREKDTNHCGENRHKRSISWPKRKEEEEVKSIQDGRIEEKQTECY